MGFQQIRLNLFEPYGRLSGNLDWFKPAPASLPTKDPVHPEGFGPLQLTCTGGYYKLSSRLISSSLPNRRPNMNLVFEGGGFEQNTVPTEILLNISPHFLVTPPTPNHWKVKLQFVNASSGMFSGSFVLPVEYGVPSLRVSFKGLIIPAEEWFEDFGVGFFLMPPLTVPAMDFLNSPRMSGSVRLKHDYSW